MMKILKSNESPSLKDYLKKYQDGNEEGKKNLKKKKLKSKAENAGVVVVDEDPVWQKPVELAEEEDDDFVDEKPQVDEDIEVKRMKRLEQARSKRALGVLSEDGSGWVPISDSSKRENSDDQISDISPPRRQRLYTPPIRESEVADLSPPRKQRARNDSSSPEPITKPTAHQRKSHQSSSLESKTKPSYPVQDSDISPPRRVRKDNLPNSVVDVSPKSKVGKGRSLKSNLSVPSEGGTSERNLSSTLDISPPRKIQKKSHIQPPKTGLVTGQEIKKEVSRTKREEWLRFKEMDPYVSGQGAEPVYRDKVTGKHMSKDEFFKSQEKKEEKPKEIKLEWGKGLAQKREAEAKLEELELEKEKPFARSRDDPELDKMLKERLRWGDPMAHLVKKKQVEEAVLPDLGESFKMKESGFVIPQEIPSHSWMKRGLDFPTNRYGIKPGRHWDGVDRSNGYEKEQFKRRNEKQATEMEAYMWSVSDM